MASYHPGTLALAVVASLTAACSVGKVGRTVKKPPVVDQDLPHAHVEEADYEAAKAAAKGKLPPLVFQPDAEADVNAERVAFGVVVKNPAAAPVDAYWTLSLARPGSTALHVSVGGDKVETSRAASIEVYSLIGRVAIEKVTIPAHGAVRFERTLPMKLIEYQGQPEAQIYWSITVNDQPQSGTLPVKLPAR